MKIKMCQNPCRYGKFMRDHASQNIRSLIQHTMATTRIVVLRTPNR